ncbi:MAG: TetR/AcrR family transcriptional regulator [Hellea sp.]
MSSANHILDAAELRMREQGYNAVSFRDIASDVGIKSASLHYHFPKKADLGLALVARYAENFQSVLITETRLDPDPSNSIQVFIDLHRRALKDQGLLCLCAVFGAEAKGLPENVTQGVRAFFKSNIEWLASAYEKAGVKNPSSRAKAGVAALEGALMVALVNEDYSVFEAVADMVRL